MTRHVVVAENPAHIGAGLHVDIAGTGEGKQTVTPPTLHTARLTLRAFVPQDWKAFDAMLADAVAMKHMHVASWNSAQRREWFDAILTADQHGGGDGMIWAIERKDSTEVIGYVGIGTADDPERAFDISFGYALAPWQWNQGFMTEVLNGVFTYQFVVVGVPQLSATCNIPNVGSARVMEKAGMTRTHSDHGPDVEGRWTMLHHYRITREDWEGLVHNR